MDSVRDKFHLHDFSHIDEELLEIFMQPSGALSTLPLKPADIQKLIDDLSNFIPLVNGKVATRRKQIKSSTHDEEYAGRKKE
jgi:hypothetical protein